ncbi:cytochrome b/b6 domain-containing protein [Desulfotruncus alcoholivorax]|uniref:cytochrome b/b6 domain-containing protein n=1 Tax=Desulfotruncus alcoholivorax TaxID=265477 RepID=UPI0004237AD8|nr:cytochrome b/b6 domain-containing protein [Desulfotruncus alcoholivorax]
MRFRNNLLGIRIKGVKTFRHNRPLRVMHWVLAPAALSLMASGLYINKPYRNFLFKNMNDARKTHFMAQYFFGLYFLARGYYAIKTRGYRKLFPNSGDIASLPKFSLYELYLNKKQPKYPKYNPLQKLLFIFFAVLFPLQIVTGSALYSTGRLQFLSRPFGGLGNTRTVHYLGAVGLMSLVAGHMYFALTESFSKLKSIFNGYFTPK